MLRSHVVVLVIAVAACGFGSDRARVALRDAPAAYAAAYCARVFECCAGADLATIFPATEIVDAAGCEAHVERVFGNEFVDDTGRAIAAGQVTYDAAAMAACLEQLRRESCPDLARVFRLTALPADCPAVRVAAATDGAPCDHDFQCVSGLCAGGLETQLGRCATPPADGEACVDGQCGPGMYCGRASVPTGACTPFGGEGAPCTNDFQCTSFACVTDAAGGRCGPPRVCAGPA